MGLSRKRPYLAGILLMVGSGPIEAHDIYSHLVDDLGRSCCNDTDCHPALYRLTATGVQMFVSERWIDVPDNTIQYRVLPGDSGRTYGGHWCGSELLDLNTGSKVHLTRCAILPPQTAFALQTPRH